MLRVNFMLYFCHIPFEFIIRRQRIQALQYFINQIKILRSYSFKQQIIAHSYLGSSFYLSRSIQFIMILNIFLLNMKCLDQSSGLGASHSQKDRRELPVNHSSISKSQKMNAIKAFGKVQHIDQIRLTNGVVAEQNFRFSSRRNCLQRYYCPKRNIQVAINPFNRNLGSLKCSVKIKKYTIPLIIIYINIQSPTKDFQIDSCSFLSQLIRIKFNDKKILIKSYRPQNILEAIIQCALMKMLENFRIGPKLIDGYLFDLLAYTDKVDIMMEELRPNTTLGKKGKQKLERKVNIMHQIGLIYDGFRSESILYSQYYKQPIFTDFSHTYSQDVKDQEQKIDSIYQDIVTFKASLKEVNYKVRKINEQSRENSSQKNVDNSFASIFQYANEKAKQPNTSKDIYRKQIDQPIASKLLELKKQKQYRNDDDVPCYLCELSEGIQYKRLNEKSISMVGFQNLNRISRDNCIQCQYQSRNIKEDDMAKLFDKNKAFNLSRKIYIQKYIELMDFFSSKYDISEKMMASHIMVVIWKIQQIDGYSMIQNCLFYLTNILLQSQDCEELSCIPLVLANAIYYQMLIPEKLINIYQKICEMNIQGQLLLQILLRSFASLQLISLKMNSNYCQSTVTKIKQIYFRKIMSMQLKNKDHLEFMKLIIKYSIINQADQFVLQNIDLFSFVYDDQQTDRNIYLTQQFLLFICLLALQSKKIFDKILVSNFLTLIEGFIQTATKPILSHTTFYFTVTFIDYCLTVNLLKYINPYIKKVYDLISNKENILLQNFKFYYLSTLKEQAEANKDMKQVALIVMNCIFLNNFFIKEDMLAILLEFIKADLMKALYNLKKNMANQLIKIFSSQKCNEADKMLYVSFPNKQKQIINSRILYKTEFDEWLDIARAIKYLQVAYYHILIRKAICPISQLPNISRSYYLLDKREGVFLQMAQNFKQYAYQLRKMVSLTNFLIIDRNNYTQKFRIMKFQLLYESKSITYRQYYQILYRILILFNKNQFKEAQCIEIVVQILEHFINKNSSIWYILIHYLDQVFFQSFFIRLIKGAKYIQLLQLWGSFSSKGYFYEHLEKISETVGLYSKSIPKLIRIFLAELGSSINFYEQKICKQAPMLFISSFLAHKRKTNEQYDKVMIKLIKNVDSISNDRIRRLILSNIFENRLNNIDSQIKYNKQNVIEQTCENPLQQKKRILKTLRRKQAFFIKNYQRYQFQKSKFFHFREERFKKRYKYKPSTVLKLSQILSKINQNLKGN